MTAPLSDADRKRVLSMLLGCDEEHAEIEFAARDLQEKTSHEAFRKLDAVSAQPLVACLRAVAKGYPELSIETLMLLMWTCARWEREGRIPTGEPTPAIVLRERLKA